MRVKFMRCVLVGDCVGLVLWVFGNLCYTICAKSSAEASN